MDREHTARPPVSLAAKSWFSCLRICRLFVAISTAQPRRGGGGGMKR